MDHTPDPGPDIEEFSLALTQAIIGMVPGGGSLLNFVIDTVPAVQRAKAEHLGLRLLEILGEDDSVLAERVRRDPALFGLIADAMYAAARADSDAQIEGLARAASVGARDTARIDEASYTVGAIARLRVIHVRVLVALEKFADESPADESPADESPKGDPPPVSELLGVTPGVGESVAADLLLLAVVETPGMSFRTLHSTVKISPFGREVLRFLRDDDWQPDL